jgi:hypothetical protein
VGVQERCWVSFCVKKRIQFKETMNMVLFDNLKVK